MGSLAFQHLAEQDHLAVVVGKFDAEHGAPGNNGHAGRDRGHVPRDVVGQPDDAVGAYAGIGFELVERHHRALAHIFDVTANAEVRQHLFKHPRLLDQCVPVDLASPRGIHIDQEFAGRKPEDAVMARRLARRRPPVAGGSPPVDDRSGAFLAGFLPVGAPRQISPRYRELGHRIAVGRRRAAAGPILCFRCTRPRAVARHARQTCLTSAQGTAAAKTRAASAGTWRARA